MLEIGVNHKSKTTILRLMRLSTAGRNLKINILVFKKKAYCSAKSNSGGSNLIGLLSTLMSSPLLVLDNLKVRKSIQIKDPIKQYIFYG